MDDGEALAKAQWLIARSGQTWDAPLEIHNFRKFCETAADAVRAMSPKEREGISWLCPWAERFAALHDDFELKVKRDPLLTYKPRTPKHQAVHDSTAFIRYLLSANTIGKTLLAYVDNIWCATGQKHWTGQRGNVVVVSTGHSVYSEKVFVEKLITGDSSDPKSPYLPHEGYWLNSFDQRKYLIRLACRECAEAGRPKDCKHTTTIQCLSADSGVERLMSFSARSCQIDEHIPEDIFSELKRRVRRGHANGRMMVTATPLAGPDSWEVRQLYNLWKERPEDNWLDMRNPAAGRYVDVFQISKYDIIGTDGGPTIGEIEAEKRTSTSSEFRARVLGEPVPLSDNPVFDLRALDEMEDLHAENPGLYELFSRDSVSGKEVPVELLQYIEDVKAVPVTVEKPHKFSGVRIWQHPEAGARYLIGVDTASGVSAQNRDASAAYVFQMVPTAGVMHIHLVACWFGYIDVYEYARQVKMLGFYYNMAHIIPETTGIGKSFMTALSRQMSYPSLYISENSGELVRAGIESRIGVETSASTKPLLASALRQYISQGRILIRDREAISECRTFQQTMTESGLSYRYEAATGAHDDRVIAMALVAYACEHSALTIWHMAVPAKPKPTILLPGTVGTALGERKKRLI